MVTPTLAGLGVAEINKHPTWTPSLSHLDNYVNVSATLTASPSRSSNIAGKRLFVSTCLQVESTAASTIRPTDMAERKQVRVWT